VCNSGSTGSEPPPEYEYKILPCERYFHNRTTQFQLRPATVTTVQCKTQTRFSLLGKNSVENSTGDKGVLVQFLAAAREFSLLENLQTAFGADPVTYFMCTSGSFPEGKVPWSQTDHCPESSAEVTNKWNLHSTILLHGGHRSNFTFHYLIQ